MLNDEGEFRQIYEAFRPRVLRHLTSIVGEDEAEDVAQDVFLKIYAALPYFRGESQLSTWIYRIVSNAAVDRIRKSSRRLPASDRLPSEVVAAEEDESLWADHEAVPAEQALLRQEMSACVQALVERLPANYRTVLRTSEEQGLKDAEVARILGLTPGTVKIRLHRARAKLRAQLEAKCTFARDDWNRLTCEPKGG